MRKRLEDWKKLELERYDTSYRRFKPQPPPASRHVCKPKIVEKIVTEFVMPETMKQLFFHAGRFSAGDRSRKACEAYRELERMGWL